MTAPLTITLDLFADPICPWCYIGKRNLEKALETYEGPVLDCRINWRTFMLNPGMPPEGMHRGAYLEAKFGGVENAGAVYGRIRQAGLAAGIDFHFEKIQRTPSTRSAHRAVRYVQETGGHGQVAGAAQLAAARLAPLPAAGGRRPAGAAARGRCCCCWCWRCCCW